MPTCAAPASEASTTTISDGNGGSDSATVTVDVTCLNDAPVAVDDTASGTEDMPVTIDPADLVADDTDVDLDTLSVTGVSNAVGGLAVLDAGSITFTPDADLCGPAPQASTTPSATATAAPTRAT